jgi:hypothetical protein
VCVNRPEARETWTRSQQRQAFEKMCADAAQSPDLAKANSALASRAM